MIAILLYVMLDFRYLAVIFITIGIYGWFTFKVTEWRVKLRKKMNDQDTDAAQKAVDSLLNFETVKYFNAEQREASRYDMAMAGYEEAALKTAYSFRFFELWSSRFDNNRLDSCDGNGCSWRSEWNFERG